jgi:hypothetical protein
MNLETLLGSLPPGQWRTKQAVCFGWYDGPLEGVCALTRPACEFYFELLDERYNPDGLDDRLYRLSEIPSGSVETTLRAVELVGKPVNPVWVPVWRFPNVEEQTKAEEIIEQIEATRRLTTLIVHTRDMEQFLGCWNIEANGQPIENWFKFLGIPQEQSA